MSGHSVKAREKPYDWADDEAALTEPGGLEGHRAQAAMPSPIREDGGRPGSMEPDAFSGSPAQPGDGPEGNGGRPSGSIIPGSASADPVFDIAVDGARNLWADGLFAAMPPPVTRKPDEQLMREAGAAADQHDLQRLK